MTDPNRDNSPDQLSIIVHSGFFDEIHYALVMASAARAVGRKVTLFFTMKGCLALTKPGPDNVPGWAQLPLGTGTETALEREARFQQSGLGTFAELLEACQQLGVKFMVCELGLAAENLTADDLADDITIITGGVVTFINDASKTGAMLFI